MKIKEKVSVVAQKLKEQYRHSAEKPNVFNTDTRTVAGEQSEPLDGLIETVLSQQSPIASTQRMANALFTKYPTWDKALKAGFEDIEATLKEARGNLTKSKAGYIFGILTKLKNERKELSLNFLRSYRPADAKKYLLALNGVGPKTASCVMLFNLQLPSQPVDTHIFRISQRLHFVTDKFKPAEVEIWFEENLPKTWQTHYEFHLNMIEHGMNTCKAQNPKCDCCVLNKLCPSAITKN